MLDKIVYEKRNVNKLVEDELDEFRKEIEAKFAASQTKRYAMKRLPEQKKKAKSIENNFLMPEYLGQACSRITLQHNNDEEED